MVGSGAGIVMVPSFLLGAAALGRTVWRPWVRAGLAIAAAGIQVGFFAGEPVPFGRGLLGYPSYALMITIEAYAFSIVFRPSLNGVAAAGWAHTAAVVAVVAAAIVGLVVLAVGLRP